MSNGQAITGLGPNVSLEIINLLLQNKLGFGMSRETYVMSHDRTKVVKIENGAESFQNIIEWETWRRIRDTEFAKYFCPCVSISAGGVALVMERTTPAKKYPDKMPAFFTDMKRQNFGMYKGRLVAHDYGVNLLMEQGMTKRMKKADWWDDNTASVTPSY